MQDLSNRIYDYYLAHFDELPLDKQFHLASRLYLWNQDPQAQQKLEQLKGPFTADNHPEIALANVITTRRASPIHGSKNAAELRRPYFEKYPELKTYVGALFRITFLKHIYELDVRAKFFEHFPELEVESYAQRLLAEPEAIAILSTHAVNFLYLYSRILKEDDKLFQPAQLLEIGKQFYDKRNLLHLQLLIYLYTHCIIGESRFYYRALPRNPVYRNMIEELEELIASHFIDINLDNKCEFLVCAQLMDYKSSLTEQIYNETIQSLAPNGTFLIDTLNNNPQTANVELDTSEHRNALFILATRHYRPLHPASRS